MPLRPDMELQDYFQIFSKRKWFIIISFLSVFFGASVYIVLTPNQYKSTTTILTIPQRVAENFVRSTVTYGAEDRLSTIQQQITSRTRLMKVVEELGLFPKMRKEGLQEEVVKVMSSRIDVEVARDPRRRERGLGAEAEAFSLSFIHEDPMVAMLTASRLASLFIEENLKLREKQAVGTSEFLESQLKDTKSKLEVQEGKVKRYKMQYSGGLPEELHTNLANITRIQTQDSTIAAEIGDAERRKVTLQTQLGLLEKGSQAVLHDDGKVEVDTSEDSAQLIARELNVKRNQLVELSAKYTDNYPDVVRLRGEVEELEKKLTAIPVSVRSSNDQEKNISKSRTYLPLSGREMQEHRNLKAQMESVSAEINALKRQRETLRRSIISLQAKIDQAPRRDQEMITVTRDYDNLKNLYNELQRKKMEANMSQDLEMRQKGDQFQILDPANLPKKPFRPNPASIFGLSFLMAIALGFGGAIGMEKMDLSLRGVTDFKHFFDIPVLATIPILETKEGGHRENLRRKAKIGGIVSVACAIFALLLFFAIKFNIF